MFPPQAVYPKYPHSITLVVNAEAPNAQKMLGAFKNAYGEHHLDLETLNPPHPFRLHLYPGSALMKVAP